MTRPQFIIVVDISSIQNATGKVDEAFKFRSDEVTLAALKGTTKFTAQILCVT